jgi:predicted TIM-barrel fold metal-dependent hydrolase
MSQSAQDYRKLGFRDGVLEKIFFTNANRLLGLGLTR